MSALINQTTSAQPEQSALSVTASKDSGSFPWWGILLIILVFVIALILAGVLGYKAFKRRKEREQFFKNAANAMKEAQKLQNIT